jgi:kynurenine formamidase
MRAVMLPFLIYFSPGAFWLLGFIGVNNKLYLRFRHPGLMEYALRPRRVESTTHHIFFKEGIFVIEYLHNLHQIGDKHFEFMALPLPIEGAGGSPVRAIAIQE